MRLPVETFTATARLALCLLLPATLAGCAGGESPAALNAAPSELAGPAADYPVVVGEPYRVAGRLYTPLDALNYDETGYAVADNGQGVSASHHTLPLPSYAEVTSLRSGRTILVRVERRGPMGDTAVIALAPAALDQLGAAAGEPVRVRRVNPPEEDRAFLRAGRSAPLRMDTPEALLTVLRRKLAPVGAPPGHSATPAALAKVELPPSTAATSGPPPAPAARQEPPGAAEAPKSPKPPEARQPATTPNGAFVVQAVALSSRERAQAIASAIGGSVSQAGRLYRVRTGPFATRAQAQASLAKVRAAGYSDARIFTNS